MSRLELALAVVALFVGLPSFVWFKRRVEWRNPTAGALVLSWAFGQVMYYVFDINLLDRRELLVYCDWFVIAIIFGKPEACNLKPYRGLRHEIWCMALERSSFDRAIIALFIIAWIVYAAPLTIHQCWLALWVIAMLQFAAAGGEAFTKQRKTRTANAVSDAPEPSGLEFAAPALVRGYG